MVLYAASPPRPDNPTEVSTMRLTNSINVIDTHAAGCPIRILTGGLPRLRGRTMLDKMLDMQQNHDWLRTMTMREPRGHREMVGAVLTEPFDPTADVGVFYIDSGWYAPMCGAGTVALGHALVAAGLVPMKEPVTEVRLETPAGVVTAYAHVRDGLVESVEFENIESFVYKENLSLDLPGHGRLAFDIRYGGNFFVTVEAEALGVEIKPERVRENADLGMTILGLANRIVQVVHPERPGLVFLNDLMFTQKPYLEDGRKIYKNTVVFGGRQTDRSPCGTGSCSRMAALYTAGELALDEECVHESVLGTRFTGRVVRAREKDGLTLVTCRLGGQAHITGFSNLVVDHADRLKAGFQI